MIPYKHNIGNFVIISIYLFSIGIMSYTTYLLHAYYVHNTITNYTPFVLWVMFYSGLFIFCLSTFVFRWLFGFMVFWVGTLIQGFYQSIVYLNFTKFGFTMEYYYMQPLTAFVGFCMIAIYMISLRK